MHLSDYYIFSVLIPMAFELLLGCPHCSTLHVSDIKGRSEVTMFDSGAKREGVVRGWGENCTVKSCMI